MMNSKRFLKAELLVITAMMAFCSIVYELLLSNTLAIVTGNYIWWQSMTIGLYIAGLGLGAYLSDHLKDTFKSIVSVEIGLSFLGAISVVYIYIFHGGYKYVDNLFFFASEFHSAVYLQNLFALRTVFFIVAQLLTIAIGLLSGFEIPLMMRMAKETLGESDDSDYQIFGLNYIGTLVGTICFAYFLLPKLDVIKTSVVVAMLNLALCFYFVIKYLDKNRIKYFVGIGGIVVLALIIGLNEYKITQRYLKFFYYMPRILAKNNKDLDDLVRRIDALPSIERTKSLYQYVDIFDYPNRFDGETFDSTILTLDTNFQFNTATEFYYHQAFAHVSIVMNQVTPKKILLLGGGDGLLLRELLKYKEIESIDFIELDAKMLELAKGRFAELNNHSLSDPRVRTQINDGFYYLRNTNTKYDAIFIDFPYPNSYDLARLYSVEFYTYVFRALNDQGFVVLDAPFYNKEDYNEEKQLRKTNLTQIFNEYHLMNNNVIASTFYYAGFKTIFPYRVAEESFLFLKKEPGGVDFNFVDRADLSKLQEETIKEIREIKNQNFPYEISARYINSIFKPTVVRQKEFN